MLAYASMRKKLLTDNVLAQIPRWRWVEGLSAADIARKIGCTIGTLRVQCSHHGLSLRRTSNPQESDNTDLQTSYQPRAEIRLNVAHQTRARLQERAALAGLSETAFVT